jgi:hypothetical protein
MIPSLALAGRRRVRFTPGTFPTVKIAFGSEFELQNIRRGKHAPRTGKAPQGPRHRRFT